MTEGCSSDGGPPRSATSAGAAPPPALITCCYWTVKFEYAFSLLKVWLVLASGQQQTTVRLLLFSLLGPDVAGLCTSPLCTATILLLCVNREGESTLRCFPFEMETTAPVWISVSVS